MGCECLSANGELWGGGILRIRRTNFSLVLWGGVKLRRRNGVAILGFIYAV